MGNTDRIVRTILALVIATLYFTDTIGGLAGLVLMVLAGIFAVTSFISFCPLYAPLGLKTCATKKE